MIYTVCDVCQIFLHTSKKVDLGARFEKPKDLCIDCLIDFTKKVDELFQSMVIEQQNKKSQ